jgi:hypothetical protein
MEDEVKLLVNESTYLGIEEGHITECKNEKKSWRSSTEED